MYMSKKIDDRPIHIYKRYVSWSTSFCENRFLTIAIVVQGLVTFDIKNPFLSCNLDGAKNIS